MYNVKLSQLTIVLKIYYDARQKLKNSKWCMYLK